MAKARGREAPAKKRTVRKRRQKGRPAGQDKKVGSEKVVSTARSLLRTARPSQLTRAEVAKAAGIDQRLVRYYFDNYDDLLDEVIGLNIKELSDVMAVASQPQDSAEKILRSRVDALIGYLVDNPSFFKLLVDRVYSGRGTAAGERLEALNKSAYERHARVIAFGQERGEFRKDFDPRLLYVAITGMAEFFVTGRPVIEVLFAEQADQVMKAYKDFIVEIVLNGIRA